MHPINESDDRNRSISEGAHWGSLLTRKINMRTSSYFALGLTTLIALVGLGSTLAYLGGAHGWWSTRSLNKWNPIGAKIGCGLSGASLLLVAIAICKRESKPKPIPAPQMKEPPFEKDREGKYLLDKAIIYPLRNLPLQRDRPYLAIFNERSNKWIYFPEDQQKESEIQACIWSDRMDDRTFFYPSGDWGVPPLYLPWV